MKDITKKLLLSPIEDDRLIGLELLKRECKDYHEMFSILNRLTPKDRSLSALLLRIDTINTPFKTKNL